MNARAQLETIFVKPDPHIAHWETDLGKKIIEGYLLKCGLMDARVISVKNLVVTFRSNAKGQAILDAETALRNKFGQLFELAKDASCLSTVAGEYRPR